MGILSLENGHILTSLVDGDWVLGTLRVDQESGTILEMGPSVAAAAGDERVDCSGRVLIPGLVVGHHHLYSALARGMPAPRYTPTNFSETLEYIWWVL
ncbi:hypothetical protein KJ865_11120, partial [Myxococcota bacterium]|nr:hypothetical protein [Myxococcota bacterium]